MNSCNGQYSGRDEVAFITLVKNSSDNGESAEAEPSPSRKASSRIQWTRSKLGFMPKSDPKHWKRSTVSGSPFGSRGKPWAAMAAIVPGRCAASARIIGVGARPVSPSVNSATCAAVGNRSAMAAARSLSCG